MKQIRLLFQPISLFTASKYLDKSAQTELHGVSLLVN